jgi:hypothetical protein
VGKSDISNVEKVEELQRSTNDTIRYYWKV